jgi:hypothetical protein
VTVLRCEIVYQGYKCVRGAYRRSDGLQPEPGVVEIPLEDMGRIEIKGRSIPWEAVTGAECDGCVDIRTWERFKKSATTTADRGPMPEPSGGLNLSGDLILRTLDDKSGKAIHEIRYSDVYVDVGIEETTRELATILEHREGLVRVPLTDIRQYYDQGGLLCRINCRRKNGMWDYETLKEDQNPWSFMDVLEFLFSQLPGSPPIVKECDVRVMQFDAPQGIEGQGESAVQYLDRFLERYGLKAQMQPDGKFAVNLKSSNRIGKQVIATAPRSPERISPGDMQYERLTSTPTRRPSAVCVVGGKRIQRESVHCVPVIQDPEDGNWYTLENRCGAWGYSLSELNRHVFVSGPRQYADVPPSPTTHDTVRIHNGRRDALKMAYRYYLPTFMIAPSGMVIGTGRLTDDPALDLVPWLPMVDSAWYLQELQGEFAEKHPEDKASKGDLDDFVLLPPVVRANYVGEKFFKTWKEFEREHEASMARAVGVKDQLELLKYEYEKKNKSTYDELNEAQKKTQETIDNAKLLKFGIEKGVVKPDGDLEVAKARLKNIISEEERKRASSESEAAKEAKKRYEDMIQHLDKEIKDQEKAIITIKNQMGEMKDSYEKNGSLLARFNTGQCVTKKAKVVDLKTGLIESSVPLVTIDKPFFFNGDSVHVVANGAVVVTFGHEIRGSWAGAYTNYLWYADDGGDPTSDAKPTFGGCHRSSPIKATMVRMESREYLQENGNPVNYNACYSEAKGKAAQMLAGPAILPGWVMELHGLRKCVLDAGICSVQHDWDGTVGQTHVSVNAPGARMPLLAPMARAPRRTDQADLRDTLQREKGDA